MKGNKFNFIITIILILFIVISAFSCTAENSTIRNEIKKKIDYSINQGTSYFQNGQIEKAIGSFTEAYELATMIDDSERVVKASLKLIEVYIYINQAEKAYQILVFIKKIIEKENLKKYLSQLHFFYAKYYELKQNFDNSIANFKEAISSATNDLDKSLALNGLGLLLLKQKKFDEALNYFIQAYNINKKLKNYDQLGNNAFNIAQCYLNKKELSKSLSFALEALEYDKFAENPYNILEDCKLIAKIYEYLNNLELAIYYITKAINIAQIIAKDQVQFLSNELKRLQSMNK